MDKSDGYQSPPDLWWLIFASLAFFLLVVFVFVREYSSDWLPIQKRFRQILEQHAQVSAAREFELGVKQLWIPALDRVDRCITCHLGYEWGTVLSSELTQPFAPHPAWPYLDKHPFGEFGCTACHGGQGYATQTDAAHGEVKHWEDPVLSTKRAALYGLSRQDLMQIRCNSCHRHDEETPGMELINRGKAAIAEYGCTACHTIFGEGGVAGPELTYEGDKNPEFLDFTRVSGEHTALNWHMQHFQNPQGVIEGSAMPNMQLDDEVARALAMLMVSWRRESFPPEYIPPPPRPGQHGALPLVTEASSLPAARAQTGEDKDGRRLFQIRGCNTCHKIGQGKSIGPDLAGVTGRRSDEWLRQWLADPAAMMRANAGLQSWPQEYGGIIMPNQNLTTQEIDALIAYMKSF